MQFRYIVGGKTYELSNGAPLTVKKAPGTHLPPTRVLTERGPLQDGDSYADYRLDPRMIMLLVQAVATQTYSTEYSRDLLGKIFRATNVPSYLEIVLKSGAVRRIGTVCIGDIDLPTDIEEELHFDAVVSLRAADPLFFNPAQNVVTFGLAAGTTGFTIPSKVPSFFSPSTINQTRTIAYAGNYRDYPEIIVYGPITNFVIQNLITGAKIDLTGVSISSGDYYTIDLRYGRKIIYRNGNTSDLRTNETTADTKLATFSIEADPEAADGLNDFRVTGTAANSQTQVYLRYYDRYTHV